MWWKMLTVQYFWVGDRKILNCSRSFLILDKSLCFFKPKGITHSLSVLCSVYIVPNIWLCSGFTVLIKVYTIVLHTFVIHLGWCVQGFSSSVLYSCCEQHQQHLGFAAGLNGDVVGFHLCLIWYTTAAGVRAVLGDFSSHDGGLGPRASCTAVDGRAWHNQRHQLQSGL